MDKRLLAHAFFIITTILCVGTKSFAEPANIGKLKIELKNYYDSGAYQKEVEVVVKQAKAYIDARAKTNAKLPNPAKLAIVLDIDDTTLSNYQDIIDRHFCDNDKIIAATVKRGASPGIAPMLALYQDAREQKIAVFFITGRRPNQQKATEKNLKAEGFTTWQGIFYRPIEDTNPSVSVYKTQARSNIERQGYKIIASIGDQDSDLVGGHREKAYKLPNPFYYLP